VPLEINEPEVADRLRRFFRTTGRIPTKLDETIVPVGLIGDLSETPYRLRAGNGVGAVTVVGAAGLTSYGAINHPVALRGATVVRQIIIRNSTAGALNYAVSMVSADYVTGQISTDFLADVEHNPPPTAANQTPGRLPVVISTGRAFPLPGLEIASVGVAAGGVIILPCEYTLTPGWQLLSGTGSR
jgi:hypothetical protein